MSSYGSDKSRVRRIPRRGHYDKETIYDILDETSVCHVAFNYDGYPVIIPTIYGREGDRLYLHGATTSRLLNSIVSQDQICISVTFVDGIILARSLFHSSMNYRSAVLFGKAHLVADEDKNHALEVISNQIIPGRWNDARLPNPKELKATNLVVFDIMDASAKIRTGPPSDDKEDYELDFWAGEIPLKTQFLNTINDPLLKDGIRVPGYVQDFIDKKNNKH